MRVLVASTGGAGHFGPLVPVVDAFVRRGDDVLMAVAPALAARARSTGLPYRLGTDPPAVELASLWERFESAPPREAAIIANREIFGRLHTAAMLPTMRDAVAECRPQLVVREPCEYASAVAAEEADVPHVQVAISLAEVEASSLALASPVLTRYQHDLMQRLLTVPYLTGFPRSVDPSPSSRPAGSARQTTCRLTRCPTGGTALTLPWCTSRSEPSPEHYPPRLPPTARLWTPCRTCRCGY